MLWISANCPAPTFLRKNTTVPAFAVSLLGWNRKLDIATVMAPWGATLAGTLVAGRLTGPMVGDDVRPGDVAATLAPVAVGPPLAEIGELAPPQPDTERLTTTAAARAIRNLSSGDGPGCPGARSRRV